jgi:hypothetical protein
VDDDANDDNSCVKGNATSLVQFLASTDCGAAIDQAVAMGCKHLRMYGVRKRVHDTVAVLGMPASYEWLNAVISTAIASNKNDTPFKWLAFIGDTVLTLMGRMQLFSLEDSAMDVGPMASAMQDLESREACQQYLKATGMDDVVLSDSYDIQAEAILCAIYLLYGLDDTERIWRMFVSAVASVDDAAPSGSSTSTLRSGKQERQQTVTTRSMESVAAWQGAELGVPDSDVSRHHRRGDQLLHPALPPRLDRPLPFLTAPTATPPSGLIHRRPGLTGLLGSMQWLRACESAW